MRTGLVICAVALCVLGPARAEWQPDDEDDLQRRAKAAVELFREEGRESLDAFFAQAYAYAIFPSVTRGGFVFGGSYGRGVLIEQGRFVGRASLWRGSLGAQLGVQRQAQIIFFRDSDGLEAFKEGRLEFSGQASAALPTGGAALKPAYLPSVAVFSRVRGGLMIQADAGGVWYRFDPAP